MTRSPHLGPVREKRRNRKDAARPDRWLRRGIIAGLAAILLAGSAAALGPHELLLLVNRNSLDSLTIANHYIALRGIPLRNVVYLDLSDAALAPESEFTPDMFADQIWRPTRNAMQERGLTGHVTAWIYSAGFPTRIGTDPKMSIHGFTFVRGEAPESEAIRLGQFASPLFRGPAGPNAPTGPSLSLEQFPAGLGSRMPLPAMTLAHTGTRGCSPADAVARLERSVRADGHGANGTVYFVTSEDVRSKARQWQYEAAVREMDELGVAAVITERFPAGETTVAGLMMGAAQATPQRIQHFSPGTLGDHLTSWAAHFDNPGQTKITAWLTAGADAAAGTVTEPLAIWTKFPAARFYAHYARGCTLLESFYQSVASPVQLLMIGDPLLAPWKPELELTIHEEPVGPEGERTFRVRLHPEQTADFVYLVDDRLLTSMVQDAGIRFPPDQLQDRHRLRIVAYTRGAVRHQVFAEMEIVPAEPDASPVLRIPGGAESDRHARQAPLRVELEAVGQAQRIGLYVQGREIGAIDGAGPGVITLDPATIGDGPIQMEAVAEYADDTTRRSRRKTLVMEDRRPDIVGIGGEVPGVAVQGPEAEQWTWTWMADMTPQEEDLSDRFTQTGEGEARVDADRRIHLTPAGREAALMVVTESEAESYEVLLVPPRGARGEAGLVWQVRDTENYFFFGWDARRSAWTATATGAGQTRRLAARGAPSPRAGQWFRLEVNTLPDDRIEFRVDGHRIAIVPFTRPRQRRGRRFSVGLRATAAEAQFQRLLIAQGQALPSGADPGRRDPPASDHAGATWLRGTWGATAVHEEIRP